MQPKPLEKPKYKSLANLLRAKIISGEYRQGDKLPSETDLTKEYDIDRRGVRWAMAMLRNEGHVITRPARGSFVRKEGERVPIVIEPPCETWSRMPTQEEVIRLKLDEGIPMHVVKKPDMPEEAYRGDRFKIVHPLPGAEE